MNCNEYKNIYFKVLDAASSLQETLMQMFLDHSDMEDWVNEVECDGYTFTYYDVNNNEHTIYAIDMIYFCSECSLKISEGLFMHISRYTENINNGFKTVNIDSDFIGQIMNEFEMNEEN